MADEWWSSARTEDGASACSTAPGTHQDAAESSLSARRSATSTDYFRPSLHVDAAASPPPPSFLAGDPPHMDWAQAAYMGGGRAATGFNALLQLHGGDSGSHFLLDQQPDVVAAGAELAAPSAASLYGDNQYSSYGDDVAAPPMAKPFSQQQLSGFFASSTRDFSDVASVPPMTTKPLLLQALEHKAFESRKEPVEDACSSDTRSGVTYSSPPAKKPRIVATPSSMPTFKVRKEKLGDRITALQQLVSPFGKTDTASVLHEAIEYIRFLHDQVASLSSPYLKCGRTVQQLQQKQDGGGSKEDLRSRGLCLVPVASTYAVASETAPEFWHPTFGGTFR